MEPRLLFLLLEAQKLEERCDSVTKRVEGKIAAEWVEELQKVCRDVLVQRRSSAVILEVDQVMIIDRQREESSRGMHSQYLAERIQERLVKSLQSPKASA